MLEFAHTIINRLITWEHRWLINRVTNHIVIWLLRKSISMCHQSCCCMHSLSIMWVSILERRCHCKRCLILPMTYWHLRDLIVCKLIKLTLSLLIFVGHKVRCCYYISSRCVTISMIRDTPESLSFRKHWSFCALISSFRNWLDSKSRYLLVYRWTFVSKSSSVLSRGRWHFLDWDSLLKVAISSVRWSIICHLQFCFRIMAVVKCMH